MHRKSLVIHNATIDAADCHFVGQSGLFEKSSNIIFPAYRYRIFSLSFSCALKQDSNETLVILPHLTQGFDAQIWIGLFGMSMGMLLRYSVSTFQLFWYNPNKRTAYRSMQITGKIRHLTTWIGIVAYLVTCLLNLPGMVLCVEKDGHMTLEVSINGVCRDSLDSRIQLDKPHMTSSVSTLSSRKSCTDVPLSLSNAGAQAPTPQLYLALMPGIVQHEAFELVTGYLATAVETRFPQPPPLKPVIHRFLNTVVLLI